MNNKIHQIFKVIIIFMATFCIHNVFAGTFMLTITSPTSTTNVPVNQTFILKSTVNSDLIFTSLPPEILLLDPNNNTVAITATLHSKYLIIDPKSSLRANTKYQMIISGYGLKDNAGNTFPDTESTKEFKFTTGAKY